MAERMSDAMLWDLYAGSAISGVMANPGLADVQEGTLAKLAAATADAMLAERAKRNLPALDRKQIRGMQIWEEVFIGALSAQRIADPADASQQANGPMRLWRLAWYPEPAAPPAPAPAESEIPNLEVESMRVVELSKSPNRSKYVKLGYSPIKAAYAECVRTNTPYFYAGEVGSPGYFFWDAAWDSYCGPFPLLATAVRWKEAQKAGARFDLPPAEWLHLTSERRNYASQRAHAEAICERTANPVYCDERGWWFMDEVWAMRLGPFSDEATALKMLRRYADLDLEGKPDPHPELAELASSLTWE